MPTASRRSVQRVDAESFSDDEAPFEVDPATDEAEEKPAPRGRRRAPESKPDESDGLEVFREPAPRRARQEDPDEDPRGEETTVPFFVGRKEIKNNRPQSEAATMFFRWAEDGDQQVVKFFDVDPWGYNQHWVTREGKQSFPCIARPGTKCPLCEVGVKKSQKIVYSIINLSHQDGPVSQVLEVGPQLNDTLLAYDEDRKTGPLPRMWWALSRTKGARSSNNQAKYNYLFSSIKDRDLEDDWGISFDEAEKAVKKLVPLTPSEVLGKIDRKLLQDVADEVMGR